MFAISWRNQIFMYLSFGVLSPRHLMREILFWDTSWIIIYARNFHFISKRQTGHIERSRFLQRQHNIRNTEYGIRMILGEVRCQPQQRGLLTHRPAWAQIISNKPKSRWNSCGRFVIIYFLLANCARRTFLAKGSALYRRIVEKWPVGKCTAFLSACGSVKKE